MSTVNNMLILQKTNNIILAFVCCLSQQIVRLLNVSSGHIRVLFTKLTDKRQTYISDWSVKLEYSNNSYLKLIIIINNN